MGRFTSPDPSQLSFADATNPQSLNLYSYVLNNPLIYIDPNGEECVWDDGTWDAADDPDTGTWSQCTAKGGSWVDSNMFESVEGNQYGSWSGQASSSIAFDWLTPSAIVNASDSAPNNGPTWSQKNKGCLDKINSTPDGKLYNFLSPLSMIPGVGNPDPAESAFEYGFMGSAKYGAFKFFQAAGQNWSGTGLGAIGKAVSGLTEVTVETFGGWPRSR